MDTKSKSDPALTPTVPTARDTWFYMSHIADDLQDLRMNPNVKAEVLATAYEYTRSIVPHYTNRERYLALMRIFIIAIIVEFNGTVVDVLGSWHDMLGYSLPSLLDTLFQGTPIRQAMEGELRTCFLFVAEKASGKFRGELFRQYTNCLADSPNPHFRLRDADSLARFSCLGALACNDSLHLISLSEDQLVIFSEIGITMYDAVAFFKHRSEGEICNLFAYVPAEMRGPAFRQCREVLWALDACWVDRTEMLIVPNVLRISGGAIHMLMRRYRFVEDGMTLGMPETEQLGAQARTNSKLWYRVDSEETNQSGVDSLQRYKDVLAADEELFIPGLSHTLETAGDGTCGRCIRRDAYGSEEVGSFGGVQLCDGCRAKWVAFILDFPDRAARAFPELKEMYTTGVPPTAVGAGAGSNM